MEGDQSAPRFRSASRVVRYGCGTRGLGGTEKQPETDREGALLQQTPPSADI